MLAHVADPAPRPYPKETHRGAGTRWAWPAGGTVDGEPERLVRALNRETNSANGAGALMAQLPSSFPQTRLEHRKPPPGKPVCGLWLPREVLGGARDHGTSHPPGVFWAQNLPSARSHSMHYLDASEDAGSCV